MTDSWLVLGMFGAVIVAAVGAMAAAIGKGVRGWPVTPQPTAVPADLQLRVQTLLDRNRPVQAVKEVREATGLNLRQARDIVDAFRGRPASVPPADTGPGGTTSLAERARNLRDAGDLPSAVALVCAESGMTQHEAEVFVSALD